MVAIASPTGGEEFGKKISGSRTGRGRSSRVKVRPANGWHIDACNERTVESTEDRGVGNAGCENLSWDVKFEDNKII